MPLLAHVLERKDVYPPGTKELVELCRRAGITTDMTLSDVCKRLKDAGSGRRKKDVGAAMRWMRAEEPAFRTSASGSRSEGAAVPGTAKIGSQFPNREPEVVTSAVSSTGTAWEPPEPGVGTPMGSGFPLYGEPDPCASEPVVIDEQRVEEFDPLENW